MDLKPGARLESTTCETQVVVVRAPAGALDLRCGGEPMAPLGAGAPRAPIHPDREGGTPMGKRYADAEAGIEVLCTHAGAGTLAVGDVVLPRKDAKPLPSSD